MDTLDKNYIINSILCFRSVDSNKLTKIGPKKRKSEAENAVDTIDKKRPKKAKIKGQNS